jgi:hypothetical protein
MLRPMIGVRFSIPFTRTQLRREVRLITVCLVYHLISYNLEVPPLHPSTPIQNSLLESSTIGQGGKGTLLIRNGPSFPITYRTDLSCQIR